MRKLATMEQVDASPAELSEMTRQALELASWSKVDLQDPQAIKTRIDDYFRFCVDNGVRPFIEGLALSLHSNRMSLLNWEKEQTERGAVIRQAKQVIRSLLETWSISGRLNPATSIFLMKNISGYVDRIEIEASADGAPKPELTPEEIQKKLLEDMPIDSDYKEVP